MGLCQSRKVKINWLITRWEILKPAHCYSHGTGWVDPLTLGQHLTGWFQCQTLRQKVWFSYEITYSTTCTFFYGNNQSCFFSFLLILFCKSLVENKMSCLTRSRFLLNEKGKDHFDKQKLLRQPSVDSSTPDYKTVACTATLIIISSIICQTSDEIYIACHTVSLPLIGYNLLVCC